MEPVSPAEALKLGCRSGRVTPMKRPLRTCDDCSVLNQVLSEAIDLSQV